MAFDESNLEKVISNIKKQYDQDTIRIADQTPDVKRIPTGIIEIDALTNGGFPLGRWSHVYGGFSSGKTLVCLHMIKNAQKMGLTCAYYDLEKQFDKKWAESVGVDTSKLWVIEGSVIEETGEKLESLLGVINIHVLDSLGLGISIDEASAGADEWRPGIQARAWGKILRRAGSHFNKEHNSVVLVNQVRSAFGSMASENPTGGRQVEHISSMTLHFKKSSWLYKDQKGNLSSDAKQDKGLHGDTTPAGIELQVRLAKSRLGDPLGSTRMRLEFGTGGQFDQDWTLVRAAIYCGLVDRSGSWYTLPDGSKVQGESGIRDYMKENEEFRELAREALAHAR